jgi:phage gp36-like protein
MPFVYADKSTILQYCDLRVVVQLTNDDETVDQNDVGNVNEPILMAMENDAAATVDNFLRNVYVVPLVGEFLTPEIKSIVAKLTWCNLWERRGDESEQVTELRKRLYDRLKAMQEREAAESRPGRTNASMGVRSTKGKVATMFDHSGYFDGLKFKGTRNLPADSGG